MKLSKEQKKILKKNSFDKYLPILTDADFLSSMFGLSFLKELSKSRKGRKYYSKYMQLRFNFKRKVSIPFLTAVITTLCTLNCKNCCHYIPEYTKETHYPVIKLDDFKQDINSLLKNIDEVGCFQISGGEPLICKDLPEMIEFLATKKQIKKIFLTTNCTIIPSDSLISALKKFRVVVQISDYRAVAKDKCHYNEIKKILQENKIKICAWEEDVKTTFHSMPEIFSDDTRDDSVLKEQYSNCTDARYTILCDGKLFNCPTCLHIYSNVSKIDGYVDVRNKNVTNEDYINFFSKHYTEYCKLCHRENLQYGFPVGEQVMTDCTPSRSS